MTANGEMRGHSEGSWDEEHARALTQKIRAKADNHPMLIIVMVGLLSDGTVSREALEKFCAEGPKGAELIAEVKQWPEFNPKSGIKEELRRYISRVANNPSA